MKKHILFLIVILLALVLVGPGDALAEEVFYLPPYADGETIVVPPGQQIVLDWAWLSTTQGLASMFIKGWSASYTIYDQSQVPILALSASDAKAFWGPIEKVPATGVGLDCPMKTMWWSFWDKPIALAPGTYTLVTDWTLRHPVTDGIHACTIIRNGQRVPPPSLTPAGSGTWTVTIVVQGP